MQMSERIRLDPATRRWFEKKPFGTQTTVVQCSDCGLFYKPELDHKCRVKKESTEKKG